MGLLLLVLKAKPSAGVSPTRLFLKQLDQFVKRPCTKCQCTHAKIFSVSGVWGSQEDLNIEKIKRIESFWKEHVKVCRPQVSHDRKQPKYILSMFPYPSGKLHMGHVRVYTLSDTIARFYRMKGMRVIHPIGWDAFGLPAENAAIEKGAQPAQWTMNNIKTMKSQLLELGCSFDWHRELATCDPLYYKWTQFLFLQLFHHGYVYRRESAVNWDPVDQTVLADEQVDENGCSWRSGAKVEKKCLRQWFIRTSIFSQSLYNCLDDLDPKRWKDVIKMQKGWIGDCNGYIMDLNLIRDGIHLEDRMSVWLEKPEYLYGVAFLNVASTHFLNTNGESINIDGRLNVYAIHPLTKNALPIFVDDTLEVARSTNSHLGVPCIDLNDKAFAEKHKLEYSNVFQQHEDESETLCNSEEFSGLPCIEARKRIFQKIKDMGVLCYPASGILRDWLISRQRYWGTPIPVVYCQNCGVVPVSFNALPVVLPDINIHNKAGISPLFSAVDWVNTKCPKCGKDAQRETDTMDTFVDSSWYYLRYLDVNNTKLPFDPVEVENAMPVDLYIGGKEHAVMHLYYARFMSHFCYSLGYIKQPEPFTNLLVQGLVTAETYRLQKSGEYIRKEEVDFSGKIPVAKKSGEYVMVQWEKMSKSKYNGIEVEDMVQDYGVDLLRLCLMANYSPFSQRKWVTSEFLPLLKWQQKLWQTVKEFRQRKDMPHGIKSVAAKERDHHERTLREIRNMFVQTVTFQMEVINDLREVINKLKTMSTSLRNVPNDIWGDCDEFERALASLIIMLSPMAPHLASELWAGFSTLAKESDKYDIKLPVLSQAWPEVDDEFELDFIVRLNGTFSAKEKITFRESKLLTAAEALDRAMTMKELQINKGKIKNVSFSNEIPYKKTEICLELSE